MKTVHEIEVKIAATQDHLTKRIDAMNDRILEMTTRMSGHMAETMLVNQFKEGGKVEQYSWEYEYNFLLSRRCFISNNRLLPATQAYKGTFEIGKVIRENELPSGMVYPDEIWLTKEEFTMRRLKGQI